MGAQMPQESLLAKGCQYTTHIFKSSINHVSSKAIPALVHGQKPTFLGDSFGGDGNCVACNERVRILSVSVDSILVTPQLLWMVTGLRLAPWNQDDDL
jgi:hypothetical protein